MNSKRLAVIGCGARSDSYLHGMRDVLRKSCRLTALADPDPAKRRVFQRNFGDEQTRMFDSATELYEKTGDEFDAVIIGSPNACHLEAAIPALQRRQVILLEKPVATTVEDCRAIWQAHQDAGMPPLAVGFVLRYTSFYRRIREVIDAGTIGQILSIEATELMGPALTALYMRGWRRHHDLAGPFILEKCSHDLDLLNWFAGAPAAQVSSFAARTRFVPDPTAAMHCRDCGHQKTCIYSTDRINPYLMDPRRFEEIRELLPLTNDLCVFNSEKDIPDHQVVNIAYTNGVLASFTASMDQPRTTRRICIHGTLGQIRGDISENQLHLEMHAGPGEQKPRRELLELQHDDSGHHGGDSVIAGQLRAMLEGKPVPPAAGLREGIEACLVALAAARSAAESRVLNQDEIYQGLLTQAG